MPRNEARPRAPLTHAETVTHTHHAHDRSSQYLAGAMSAGSTGASAHKYATGMIVTCGALGGASGRGVSAAAVARRAAANGASVQVVGVLPEGPVADRLLLELAAEGIGHAAVLREPARDLEAADLDLALRYLPEVRVVVVVEMQSPVVAAAAERTQWSGAALIVLGRAPGDGTALPADLPDGVIVLEAPASDPDATFAGFVGAFAARLDAGATAADAWAATTHELAVDSV